MPTLAEHGFDVYTVREEVLAIALGQGGREASQQKKEPPFLSEYGRDLTGLAAEASFDPLIGRDDEVDRIVHFSCALQKQPDPARRAGVGEDGHRRGSGAAHRRRRLPTFLAEKRISSPSISRPSSPYDAPRAVQGAHEGFPPATRAKLDAIVFIDEILNPQLAPGRPRVRPRRQHLEAGALARRDLLHPAPRRSRSTGNTSRRTGLSCASSASAIQAAAAVARGACRSSTASTTATS